jgi:hypothetical protein
VVAFFFFSLQPSHNLWIIQIKLALASWKLKAHLLRFYLFIFGSR